MLARTLGVPLVTLEGDSGRGLGMQRCGWGKSSGWFVMDGGRRCRCYDDLGVDRRAS